MKYFFAASEVILLLAALFGFCYGAGHYFKPKKALFPQIVVCGLGCLFIGQLFVLVRLLVGNSSDSFHVGMLAPIGFYLFLLSANYGQMDSLLDNDVPQNRKYARIALAAPAAVLLMSVGIFFSGARLSVKIIDAVSFAFCAAASYFNLKHAIYPDVEDGIVGTIRGYNRLALLIETTNVAATLCAVYGLQAARCVLLLSEAFFCAAIMPVFRKGAVRWYR